MRGSGRSFARGNGGIGEKVYSTRACEVADFLGFGEAKIAPEVGTRPDGFQTAFR
jgi:hypothetical protein